MHIISFALQPGQSLALEMQESIVHQKAILLNYTTFWTYIWEKIFHILAL